MPSDDILKIAGYKDGENDVPTIARVFPDLKTEKQQDAAQKIIDGLSRSSDLKDSDIDKLVEQVEMFLEYAKKRDSK